MAAGVPITVIHAVALRCRLHHYNNVSKFPIAHEGSIKEKLMEKVLLYSRGGDGTLSDTVIN